MWYFALTANTTGHPIVDTEASLELCRAATVSLLFESRTHVRLFCKLDTNILLSVSA